MKKEDKVQYTNLFILLFEFLFYANNVMNRGKERNLMKKWNEKLVANQWCTQKPLSNNLTYFLYEVFPATKLKMKQW